MTPERWMRIEELYHAARARPPDERGAYLAEACPDDHLLRHEVESLLGEADDGLLADPAVMPSHVAGDSEPPSMTGRSIGGYQLEALLGAGGMGEVYHARDTKLARDVAIKILPSVLTRHPDRLARLEREARMLAALNHANICGIHDIGEADGIRFLVLELIEGDTLAQVLARASSGWARGAGLPLHNAVIIARQIVDALEAAHEKGIVHRDLKPENVKIRPDGVVKVLDFGLAKVVGGAGPQLTLAPAATAGGGGAVLGTAAYMSPEQARGLPVDKRTDIWAFGCVLYEMVSGRVAFAGDTVSDVIARILEHEPDWSLLPVTTPAAVRRLLLRCLTKVPARRLRDIGDARLELDTILDERSDVRAASASARAAGAASNWLPWVALAALATGIAVWEAARAGGSALTDANPLADAQFTRMTAWDGAEGSAEISPDGRFVAFLADHDRPFDLWRTQVGTGEFVNLTSAMPARPGSPSLLRSFGFSADGAGIWFFDGRAKGHMLMPLTPGMARPFLGADFTALSWSPDGERLAYMTISLDQGDSLSVADRTGTDAMRIVEPEAGRHNHNPVWSPDGQWIYFVRGFDPTEGTDVWRVRPSGGPPEQLTAQNAAVNFLAPLDARTLLYVARGEDWSGPWLWALDVEGRVRRRVSLGVEQYTSVAASRDGRRIVATVANPTASLWHVPVGESGAEARDAEPYPLPQPRALAPRFGGSALFYLSTSGVADGLWRAQDAQSVPVRNAAEGALFEPPAVSRDGKRIAVVLRREGRRRLVIMSPEGTDARTLAPSIQVRGAADFSPDGEWIVIGGRDEQGGGLFKVPDRPRRSGAATDRGTCARLPAPAPASPARSARGYLSQ
jgi:hypothetical protein